MDAQTIIAKRIAQELRDGMRRPLSTKRYGDRISNAPGARTPSAPAFDSGPEISISRSAVGRETLAAINADLHGDEPITGVRHRSGDERDAPSSSVQPAHAIEVFEMMTFVARGDVSELSSNTARRAFVEERRAKRINHLRVEQALEVEPAAIATGCPYCLMMLEDGARAKGVYDSVPIADVAEVLEQSLESSEAS